ncbi:hypothetical protein BKG82_28560 [Mycobacteroides chelonae]|uniref:Uncharacterized protein n=1 Tax=Mycobacteroides chelonae TaxID=1774 RepID=A0A1S1LFL7_MYCCH|nr:hypothetical protein BKG82_28560 [Mycobacteroides chelonae]
MPGGVVVVRRDHLVEQPPRGLPPLHRHQLRRHEAHRNPRQLPRRNINAANIPQITLCPNNFAHNATKAFGARHPVTDFHKRTNGDHRHTSE